MAGVEAEEEEEDVCSWDVFVEGVCGVCMRACWVLEEGEEDEDDDDDEELLSAGAPSAWLIKKLIHSSARLSP